MIMSEKNEQRSVTLRRFLIGIGIGFAGLAMGGGLFFLAWWSATFHDDLKERGVRAEAFIVDLWTEDNEGPTSPGSEISGTDYVSYHFKVRFTPAKANELGEAESSLEPMEAEVYVEDGEYSRWNEVTQQYEDRKPGEVVEILYLPDNPERVETVHSIENESSGLLGMIVLGFFGLLAIGLGGVGCYMVMFVGPAPE